MSPSALAESDILPIEQSFDRSTDSAASPGMYLSRLDDLPSCRPVWLSTQMSGYFLGRHQNECILDWGDLRSGIPVGSFVFDTYTNSQAADGDNSIYVAFYRNDNGWGDPHRRILALFHLENLPGSDMPPNQYLRTVWQINPDPPLLLDGDDLDGDGLGDFSYAFHYATVRTPNAHMGTSIAGAGDANYPPPTCPGIEDAFDLYRNVNWITDPNLHRGWVGTFSGRGSPFVQFYLALYAPACPVPGDSEHYCIGDIGNFNCIVDLADLAQLLAHYGETFVWYPDGDIFPPHPFQPGDGVIDLNDLAEMLAQYGDDCRAGE